MYSNGLLAYHCFMHQSDPIEKHFRLTGAQRSALKKLGFSVLLDLLYHFPARYTEAGKVLSIADASDGERVSVYGRVEKTETRKSFRSKMPIGEVAIRDDGGVMKLIWFRQPYMAKMLAVGDLVRASGIVKRGKNITLINPEVTKVAALPNSSDSLFNGYGVEAEGMFPVYPESRGITSRWFLHAIRKVLASGIADQLSDPLPDEVRGRFHLPALKTALVWIHSPRDEKHAQSARKRFSFEEIFFIQLKRRSDKASYEANPAFDVPYDAALVREFVSRFGFPLTAAQKKAVHVILSDLSKSRPMLRLLEGDVGSGKTAVAATAAALTVSVLPSGQKFGNLQVAYMCPTEILASQHFESFIRFFIGSGISIGLITGSGCKKFPSKVDPAGWTDISRAQFLKWVANGEIPIVIGTHALIQKSIKFKHLAFAIIDEQHRFGTSQRAKLVQKDGRAPHLLSMTATPIPRTLALTLYGDLDLTLLDEMPSGRKAVITKIIMPKERNATYEHIRREIMQGRQAYIICPRIDEPDPAKEMALEAKSVIAEAKRLKQDVFPEFELGVLHGKMTPKDKDAVMERFSSGEIHILVATSVVEVGVNVPNATVIAIEGAERFGLAQLHQLRGRVLRGTHQAYCYLLPNPSGAAALARLKALTKARNGFELSEMDLAIRGAGELSGGKQWGISDVGMEAIKNLKMVEAAREEATRLLADDPELSRHPTLKQLAEDRAGGAHFE
jgi:ATP-dependent DNA helicase RecG